MYVKVIANNIVGSSIESSAGNGAQLLRAPDAPLNLENVASITTSSQIGLAWEQGAEDGGISVVDYTLFYD